MTLVLEVEYLSGVSFAAIGPDSEAPDWPPQPDRIFSALVATWAARGQVEEETEALQWLEKQPIPLIVASNAKERTGATVFVPPNDPRSDKKKRAKEVLPALRSRQARRFPATRPHDPIVRLCWNDITAEEGTFTSLQRLASDTAYIGHSTSLTRCRFVHDHNAHDFKDTQAPHRSIYPGRFAELHKAYSVFEKSGGKRGRPLPGARVAHHLDTMHEQANLFSSQWLLLEHITGDMSDIRACAVVTKTLRDAIMSGYRRIGRSDDIPEVISGHMNSGDPARAPHLAIIPLSFTGFPYADGHVLGFALVPPSGSTILDDEDFRRVLRKLAPIGKEHGRRVLLVVQKGGSLSGGIGLSPTFEPPVAKRSLDPSLYIGPASCFATVTPAVLDRHLKQKGAARQEEMVAQIVNACRNIGLPEPESVVVDKHSAVEGAPSAYPSGKSPSWMRWRLPPSLASRQLTHAVIQFAKPVDGPVILGAGRFIGLGLCRALDRKSQ